ncbi:MAG: hypothetical protein ACI802_000396 [Candidatus Paceibacteria bacterium]|jgi:hypothetical protein
MSLLPIAPHSIKQDASVTEKETLSQPLLDTTPWIGNTNKSTHFFRSTPSNQQLGQWQVAAQAISANLMAEVNHQNDPHVDHVALATSIALVEEIRDFHTTPPKERAPGRKRNFPELTTRVALEDAAIMAYLRAVDIHVSEISARQNAHEPGAKGAMRSADAALRLHCKKKENTALHADPPSPLSKAHPPTMLGIMLSTRKLSACRVVADELARAITTAGITHPERHENWQHLQDTVLKAESLLRIEQSFKHMARNATTGKGIIKNARQKFRANVLSAIKSDALSHQHAINRQRIAAMVGEYELACREFRSEETTAEARSALHHRLSGQLHLPADSTPASSPISERINRALTVLSEKISCAIDASQQAMHGADSTSPARCKTAPGTQLSLQNLLLDLGNLTTALHTLQATQSHSSPSGSESERQQRMNTAMAMATDKLKALTHPEVIQILNGDITPQSEEPVMARRKTANRHWRYAGPLAHGGHPATGDHVASAITIIGNDLPLFIGVPLNRPFIKEDISGPCLEQLLKHSVVPKQLTLFNVPNSDNSYSIDLSTTGAYQASFNRSTISFGATRLIRGLWEKLRSTSPQLASAVLALPVRVAYVNGLMKRTRKARKHMHEDLFVARKMLEQYGHSKLHSGHDSSTLTFWQRMMARGFGQSSYSKGLGLPFVESRQKTPEARNQRKVAMPHFGAQQENPANLPLLFRTINLDQILTEIDLPADHPVISMNAPDYLQHLSNDARLFPGTRKTEDHAKLMRQLQHVEQYLRDDSDKLSSLHINQDGALLVRALSAACTHAGTNAIPAQLQAARALACLRNIDLAGSLCKPAAYRAPPSLASLGDRFTASDNTPFTDSEHALAWRTAQMLAKTPAGMTLLTKLTLPTKTAQHPSVIEQKTQMLKLFLTAAAELDTELQAAGKTEIPSPTPAALLAYAERSISQLQPGQNSVLIKALNALPAHLRHSEQFTGNDPFLPIPPDAHRHDWAIGAVRNGLTSDIAGSPFYRIEDRLVRKIAGKWVDLATSKAKSRWKRVTTGISPLRYKSPFNAFKKTDGSYKNLTQGSTLDRRHMRMASEIVEALLARPPLFALHPEEALRRDVRLAFLREWKTRRIPTLLEGDQCDQHQLQVMAESLAATPGMTASPETLKAMLEEENKRYLPELLDKWLMEEQATSGPATAEQTAQYAQSIARVKGATTELRMGPMTRENLANGIADLIRDELELGAGLTLTNGGSIGASTKGITQLIVGALTGWMVRGSVYLRMHRLRHAALEFKLSSAGVELRAGSQTIKSKAAGFGVLAGLGMNALNIVKFRVGGGIAAEIGDGNEHFSGVVLRLPRGKNGVEEDPAVRARFAEVVRRLLLRDAGSHENINAPGSDGASPLKNLLQQFNDLSVNLVGQSLGSTSQRVKNAELSARASVGTLELGPTAAISTNQTVYNETYKEEQGRIRVEKTTREVKRGVNIATRAFGGFPIDRIPGRAVAALPPALTLADVNTDVWNTGDVVKQNLIFQDGQIDVRTFVIKAYGHLDGFVEHITDNLDVWCAARARKFFPDEYHGGPERRQKAIKEEHRRISHFIDRAKKRVAETQTFFSNLDINPYVADEINRLMAVSTMMALNGDAESSKKVQVYCQLRLKEKTAWESINLISRETVSEQINRPFQAGVDIRAISRIVTTNLLDII